MNALLHCIILIGPEKTSKTVLLGSRRTPIPDSLSFPLVVTPSTLNLKDPSSEATNSELLIAWLCYPLLLCSKWIGNMTNIHP